MFRNTCVHVCRCVFVNSAPSSLLTQLYWCSSCPPCFTQRFSQYFQLLTHLKEWIHLSGIAFQSWATGEIAYNTCIQHKWTIRALSSTYPMCNAWYFLAMCYIAMHSDMLFVMWWPYLTWAWACAIEPACRHNAVLGVVNRRGWAKGTVFSVHGPWLYFRSKEQSFYW